MLSDPWRMWAGRSHAQQSVTCLRRPSRSPTDKAPESRSEPELAAPPSTPGSVSMAVLCYHQLQAFGRPAPINGSPRGRRRARPRRSNVVFTPVTTHSSGREKVAGRRWCGHKRLNCGLQKPCDTSYYMQSEPWHVGRPFSRTVVHQVPRRPSRPPTEKAPESRSEPN